MARIEKKKIAFKGGIEERISRFAQYSFISWVFVKLLAYFGVFPVSWINFLLFSVSILFSYVVCLLIQGLAEYFAILKKKEGYDVFLSPSKPDFKTLEVCSSCNREIGTLSYNTRECQYCDEKLEGF